MTILSTRNHCRLVLATRACDVVRKNVPSGLVFRRFSVVCGCCRNSSLASDLAKVAWTMSHIGNWSA